MIARVVVPNIWSGILTAAFISIALVLGEYTFASLLHFDTLPVAIAAVSARRLRPRRVAPRLDHLRRRSC